MEDDEKDQTTGKKEGKSNNQTERRGRVTVRRLLATNIYGRQAPNVTTNNGNLFRTANH